MRLTKLSWATVLIESRETRVLIDPLGAPIRGQELPLAARLGEPLEPLVPLGTMKRPNAILITHYHPDHFDYRSIIADFGNQIPIYIPKESVGFAKKVGFQNVISMVPNDQYTINDVRISSSFSVDGFGTPQVSWVVSNGEYTVFHCGDTQWHGYWWRIEEQYGPIHVACMPVNGPILEVNGLKNQSHLPACLTPEEAVEASKILNAKFLVPIHYKTFNNPPYYSEADGVEERLLKRGEKLGVKIQFLQPKETLKLGN